MLATHLYIMNILAIGKQKMKGTGGNKHITFAKIQILELHIQMKKKHLEI